VATNPLSFPIAAAASSAPGKIGGKEMNIVKSLPATIGAGLYQQLTKKASTDLALLLIWTLSGLILSVVRQSPMVDFPG
jgi:hypothetical protein